MMQTPSAHRGADSASFAGGVKARLAAHTGRDHVLLTGRAAAGLTAALLALDRPGAAVILPALTCHFVLWAVLRAGMVPVLADVEPDTISPSVVTLEAAFTAASVPPAAVIMTGAYGLPAPFESVLAWATGKNITLIADCAHDPFSTLPGHALVYSFGAGKTLDHAGGGAVITGDAAYARAIEAVLHSFPRYTPHMATNQRAWDDIYWGLHLHADDDPRLHALYRPLYDLYAPLTAYRLPADHWHGWSLRWDGRAAIIARRARLAEAYTTALTAYSTGQSFKAQVHITLPTVTPSWKYPIHVSPGHRDAILDAAWAAGLHSVTRWYPSLQGMATALHPASHPPTPAADDLAASIITLPLDAAVDDATIACLVDALRTITG